MNTTRTSEKTRITEEAVYDRRRFLHNTALAVGAAQLGIGSFAQAQPGAGPATATAGTSDGIRPFRINIPDADLADLRRRILVTRWPEREQVQDATQGVQSSTMHALAGYWGTEYD